MLIRRMSCWQVVLALKLTCEVHQSFDIACLEGFERGLKITLHGFGAPGVNAGVGRPPPPNPV